MRSTSSKILLLAMCASLSAHVQSVSAEEFGRPVLIAAAPQADEKSKQDGQEKKQEKKEPTPEEKMQARFPQPVLVSHLIGLPVLDGNDSTIGYVQHVVRTPDGKIKLVVPYSKRFGWARNGSMFDWGRRPVAVPIEVVGILGLQIAAVDMEREAFDKAPTWSPSETQAIPPDEIIKIALQRR